MARTNDIIRTFDRCLRMSTCRTWPYRHWLLTDILPAPMAESVQVLPFAPADIADTNGKRETHNGVRVFFSTENCDRFLACREVADAFQAKETIRLIEDVCGTTLDGSYLRIEYCQDQGDFWLEPHTDIGAKLFTMLIYLSDDEEGVPLGTDIYDGDLNLVGTAPYGFNRGLIFVPAADTWHGFRKRAIAGIRKSIIINYVKNEWRSRHELAFPAQPVRSLSRH